MGTNIIAKLRAEKDLDTLVITDGMKVSADLIYGTNRIGAWKGDLFAVWEVEGRMSPSQAETEARRRGPDAIYVVGEDNSLFRLDDRYLVMVNGGLR